jgi:hypothetical protein
MLIASVAVEVRIVIGRDTAMEKGMPAWERCKRAVATWRGRASS